MGASAGTLVTASDEKGTEVVKKLRTLATDDKTVLEKALIDSGVEQGADTLAAKFLEHNKLGVQDKELWHRIKADDNGKLNGAQEEEEEPIAFVPRKDSSTRRHSKTDELKKEIELLKYDPSKDDDDDGGDLITTYLINPEFKRPGTKRRVPYPPIPPDKPRPFPGKFVGAFSCHGQVDVGKYKDNQDRGVVAHPFAASGPGKQSLFIVCDGHGEYGHKVSDYVVKLLVDTLQNHDQLRANPEAALADSYAQVDKALEKTRIDSYTSGTTCVSVVQRAEGADQVLYVANVGDSRAVIGKCAERDDKGAVTKVTAHDLTIDQKPDDEKEKARITAAGGFVSCPAWSASARVWLDAECQWPGLAMARSIGDHCVKEIGVTSQPETSKYVIAKEDHLMILASDGIWEFLESQDALDIVMAALTKHAAEPDPAEKAAQELIKCAMRQWKIHEQGYRDDITASVVLLDVFRQAPPS